MLRKCLAIILFITVFIEAILANATPWQHCRCNYSTSYNDIVYLFDRSSTMTANGLNMALQQVKRDMTYFNLQLHNYTETPYFTQNGAISYASKAQMISNLGDMSQKDIAQLSITSDEKDDVTNLYDALRLAIAQFKTLSHRHTSTKVILIFASRYNGGRANETIQLARQFREAGGVVMVGYYGRFDDSQDDTMTSIASAGFFFDSRYDSEDTIRYAYCGVNCFCPTGYEFYNDPYGSPRWGCFYVMPTPMTYAAASSQCKKHRSDTIQPVINEMQQAEFLSFYSANTPGIWIGLTYDNVFQQAYEWSDGSSFNQPYLPWVDGKTPVPQNGQNCVRQIIDSSGNDVWLPCDCREKYMTMCQAPPCDSTRFCTEPH